MQVYDLEKKGGSIIAGVLKLMQEKKKNPKGRAMKRIKYNRRFVNVGEPGRHA